MTDPARPGSLPPGPSLAGASQPGRPPMRRLQALDRRLGPALCAGVALPRLVRRGFRALRARLDTRRGVLRPAAVARRVLLVKFWGIGSLQLLAPAARALRERHPGATLTLLTLTDHGAFATALGIVDEVRTLDVRRGGVARLVARLAGLTWALRRERYDVVYDFEFLTRTSALVGALAGPRRLVGYTSPRAFRGGLHDETLPFDEGRHVADVFRDLAAGEVLAPVRAEEVPPARVAADDLAAVDRLLVERLGGPEVVCLPGAVPPGVPRSALGTRPLAVLNPNAGELAPERRWPAERFGALAEHLVVHGFDIALIGAPSEVGTTALAAAAAPRARAAERLLDLSGGLSLGELVALLSRADLVVSNDSGPMHLAAALGVPTLGLFGPETPRRYGPIGARTAALSDPPPCGPCINVHDNKLAACVMGRAECMTRISVDAVLAAALALVSETTRGAASGGGTRARAAREQGA